MKTQRKSRVWLCSAQLVFGPSGVRALPLAAGINEGGHYFAYILVRACCVRHWRLSDRGFGDLVIWEFGDLGIRGFGHFGIWALGDLGIWGFWKMGIGDFGIMGFGDLAIW